MAVGYECADVNDQPREETEPTPAADLEQPDMNDETDAEEGGGVRRGLGRGLEALFKPLRSSEDGEESEEEAEEGGDTEDEPLDRLRQLTGEAAGHLEAIRKIEEEALAVLDAVESSEAAVAAGDPPPLHIWRPVHIDAPSPPQHEQLERRSMAEGEEDRTVPVAVNGLPGFAALAELADRLPQSGMISSCALLSYEKGDAELELVVSPDTSVDAALDWLKAEMIALSGAQGLSVELQERAASD